MLQKRGQQGRNVLTPKHAHKLTPTPPPPHTHKHTHTNTHTHTHQDGPDARVWQAPDARVWQAPDANALAAPTEQFYKLPPKPKLTPDVPAYSSKLRPCDARAAYDLAKRPLHARPQWNGVPVIVSVALVLPQQKRVAGGMPGMYCACMGLFVCVCVYLCVLHMTMSWRGLD